MSAFKSPFSFIGLKDDKYVIVKEAPKNSKDSFTMPLPEDNVNHPKHYIKEFSFSEALQYIPEGVNPIEYERKIDAEIRAERQALVDLWKQDDQAWNLYCYGKRASK